MEKLVILVLFLVTGGYAELRIKRDGDFFSNLGQQLGNMLSAFLGQGPNNQQQSQNSPPVFQQQIQQPPQQIPQQAPLPTLGANSAYDRKVAQLNSRRRMNQPMNHQPPLPQQSNQGQGQDQQEKPVQVIDQNGRLSYCTTYPADCSYLSCLADNFQRSEEANNLKMAGKVFLDRKLRRAVANDPMISQAACDRVGLDSQGCQGFRQLLGIVDKFDPGPTSDERRLDPEENRGRRKRAQIESDMDFDHFDQYPNPRSRRDAGAGFNGAVNGNRPFGQTIINANGNVNNGPIENRNQNQGRSNGNVHRGGRIDYPDYDNAPSRNRNQGTRPNVAGTQGIFSTQKPIGNARGTGKHTIDYPDESGGGGGGGGGSAVHGNQGWNGNNGNTGHNEQRYQPKDCKAIVRHANRGR